MATRKPMFLTEFGGEEMAATDDIALGGLAMSGDITMAGNEVTGLPAVPSATGAVSKEYADAIMNDARPKASVRAGTTGALPAYTAAGSGVGKTLTADANGAWSSSNSDGVSLSLNDRFLVKDEAASHVDHGIYTLTQVGDAGTPWILTRATDFDNDSEVIAGAHTWVSEGTTQDNSTWSVVTNDPITVDTTAIQFSQTQGPGAYTGGDGIDISAGVISVDLATSNPGLYFDSNKLSVLLDGTTLAKGASGLSVQGLPSLFEINGSAVSANVTAANLNTLTAGSASDADALHTHNNLVVDSAARLEDELTANEALALGDPVEWGGANDQIRECQASVSARVDCIGVVEEAGGIGASGTGTVVLLGVATGVISGATVGDRYFVGDSGGLIQGISGISAGNHIVFVGTAKNATDLDVRPYYVGRKAA